MRSVASRAFRPAFSAISARSLSLAARPAPLASLKVAASSRTAQSVSAFQQVRFASSGSLSKDDISSRILEVLKSFEKVDPAKVSANSSFTNDLGLDSLDAVEVVMAIEEEFSIEIPDEEADAISTVGQAIDYISKTPEAH